MKISLDALQLLDAIDLRESFAGAAAALHRVPSAVTHAVRRLEEDLGVQLFERSGRRATLTAAGRTLLEDGRHLLRAAGELECRVRRIATGWEAELRIAVEAAVGPERLFPLISEFQREARGTRLRLTTEVLGGCWDALATGRADLAVGAPGEPPPGAQWTLRPLGELEFAFVMAPDHPLASAPEPLTPQTVAPHRAVALADTSRQLLARTTGLVSGQDVLTVDSGAAKLAALVAGLGVGHLPRAMIEAEVAAGRLVMRRLDPALAPKPLWLAWPGTQQGQALQWFVERLDTPRWRRRLLALPSTLAATAKARPTGSVGRSRAGLAKPSRPSR